ncbi:dihydrofolate reductase-like domain-containing protein [Lentinula raphanica]|nr:dihydrofolate reductase-like domain-containing protein [Lentinula raphanica]
MTSTDPPTFLSSLLGRYKNSAEQSRPFVTLTFAQSLDAKIAGRGGKQLILSGKESMVMTHWMRTMHDGILIGIGTALNDDPQLNGTSFECKGIVKPDQTYLARHLPANDSVPSTDGHNHPYSLPRPIILDTNLRFSSHSKLLKNYAEGKGRRPWLICAEPWDSSEKKEWLHRRTTLEKAGARTIVLENDHNTQDHLPIPSVLQTLHRLGILSVMVEGGAQIIRSFLSQIAAESTSSFVDTMIITVAPVFVGEDGISYNTVSGSASKMKHASTAMFGQDTVVGLIPTESVA